MAASSRKTPSRTHRAFRLVGEYAGWLCLIVVGIGMFAFFNVRSDLVACNAAYSEYNSKAQVARTDASTENNKALFQVIRASQPLIDPNGIATLDQRMSAYEAYRAFTDTHEDYSKVISKYPYKTYDQVCKETQ